MKDIEIINEDVEPQHLFAIEKRNDKTLDTESKGIITIEKKYGYNKVRATAFSSEKGVPEGNYRCRKIFRWLPDYKGVFEGYNGGTN